MHAFWVSGFWLHTLKSRLLLPVSPTLPTPALTHTQVCNALEFYLLELTRTAVFFILLKKALSHSPWVSGVREQDTTMKSLSDTSVSSGTVQQRGEEEEQKGKRGNGSSHLQVYFPSAKSVILLFPLLLSCPSYRTMILTFPLQLCTFLSCFLPNSPFTLAAWALAVLPE